MTREVTPATVGVHAEEIRAIARAVVDAHGPVGNKVIVDAVEARMKVLAGDVAISEQGKNNVTSLLAHWRTRVGLGFENKLNVLAEPGVEDASKLAEIEYPLEGGPDEEDPTWLLESEEGRRFLTHHLQPERDPKLVQRAKARFRHNAPDQKLRCELCGFCYEDIYGPEVGGDYIECHHRIPVATMEARGRKKTALDDLLLVCANCHRILHRRLGNDPTGTRDPETLKILRRWD